MLGRDPSVFANGAIHWLDNDATILSFDLDDEKFSFVPEEAPQEKIPKIPHRKIGVLRGSLCMTTSHFFGISSSDIWIANNKVPISWPRKFNLPWEFCRDLPKEVVAISKGGKILVHSKYDGSLFSYDPKTEILSGIENAPALKRFHMIPYTKSFVSLKGLGEEDAKCIGIGRGRGRGKGRGQSSTTTARIVSVDSSSQHFMRPPLIPPAQVLRPPWRVPGRGRGYFGGGGAINTTGSNTGRGQMSPIGVNRSAWRGSSSSSSTGRGNGGGNTGTGNGLR